jgi:hypothetical protein
MPLVKPRCKSTRFAWYSQAAEWMDENTPDEDRELRNIRAEAAALLGMRA